MFFIGLTLVDLGILVLNRLKIVELVDKEKLIELLKISDKNNCIIKLLIFEVIQTKKEQ